MAMESSTTDRYWMGPSWTKMGMVFLMGAPKWHVALAQHASFLQHSVVNKQVVPLKILMPGAHPKCVNQIAPVTSPTTDKWTSPTF